MIYIYISISQHYLSRFAKLIFTGSDDLLTISLSVARVIYVKIASVPKRNVRQLACWDLRHNKRAKRNATRASVLMFYRYRSGFGRRSTDITVSIITFDAVKSKPRISDKISFHSGTWNEEDIAIFYRIFSLSLFLVPTPSNHFDISASFDHCRAGLNFHQNSTDTMYSQTIV